MMEENLTEGFEQTGRERALLRFLNRVFYRNPWVPFLQLLPKLYKKRYRPCEQNLVVRGGKRLRAAVGLYMLDLHAGGGVLHAGGIGNVAVGKRYRGRGYMKRLMRMAADACIARDADFMVLGGLRQRYQYFGFERCGQTCRFTVTKTNLRHFFRGREEALLTARKLRRDDEAALRAIYACHAQADLRCSRPEEPAALWDSLRSWFLEPYALEQNGVFAGYFLYSPWVSRVEELRLVDWEHAGGAVRAIFRALGRAKLRFSVLSAETRASAFFNLLCEQAEVVSPECFCILNYARVLQAMLRLRAKIAPLCEGGLAIRIKGFAREENLMIRVRDGEISIGETRETPDITLEHLAAMRCFFAPVSDERRVLPAHAAAWFPLPLGVPFCDMI